jgi:hypothetical protein
MLPRNLPAQRIPSKPALPSTIVDMQIVLYLNSLMQQVAKKVQMLKANTALF